MTTPSFHRTGERRHAIAHLAILLIIVSIGTCLRFWRAGDMIVFADELHSLQQAITHSASWILTHYSRSDSCIPLTLYNKLLLQTVGLNEWLFRLPSLLAGASTVAVTCFVAFRFLTPLESILVTGAISFSPYLVYLSRESRPYSLVMLLFSVSLLLVLAWTRGGPRPHLIIAAVLSALAVYFHPVVAPSVLLLGLYPPCLFVKKKLRRDQLREYVWAAAVFGLIMLALMGPALPSLLEGIAQKAAKGSATSETIRHGLMLIHSFPLSIPLWIWGITALVGLYSLARRYPSESLLLAVILIFQTSSLLFVQPAYMEIPWVWLRYLAHLVPFFCVLVVCGLTAPVGTICDRSIFLQAALPLGLVALFLSHHLTAHRYSILQADGYNVHPMILFLPANPCSSALEGMPSPFYRSIIQDLPPGALLETPMLVTFPLYGIYQRCHGRIIYTGTLGEGAWQTLFDSQPGIHFRKVVPLNNRRTYGDLVPRYLVVHKRIKEEMRRIYELSKHIPYMNTQIAAMDWLFSPSSLSRFFGKEEILPFTPQPLPALIYEDSFIAVHDLWATGKGT